MMFFSFFASTGHNRKHPFLLTTFIILSIAALTLAACSGDVNDTGPEGDNGAEDSGAEDDYTGTENDGAAGDSGIAAEGKAPAFSGTDMLTGTEIVFPGASENEATFLVFFSINCPPCRDQLPETQNNKNVLQEMGVDVIVVASGNEAPLKDFWEDNGIELPTIIDAGNAIFSDYGIAAVPTYVIIDAAGNTLSEGHVYLTPDDISALLN